MLELSFSVGKACLCQIEFNTELILEVSEKEQREETVWKLQHKLHKTQKDSVSEARETRRGEYERGFPRL